MPEVAVDVVILAVVGLGWWWLWRELRSLRELVRTQRQTIETHVQSQESLGRVVAGLETLADKSQQLLTATDQPRMLERLKAVEEAVDREKEAVLRSKTAEFDEQKKQLTRALFEVYGAASKHLSQDELNRLLDIAGRADPGIREALSRISAVAPIRAQRFLLFTTEALVIFGQVFKQTARDYDEMLARGVISREAYDAWARVAQAFKSSYLLVYDAWSPILGTANPPTVLDAVGLLLHALRDQLGKKKAELFAAAEAQRRRESPNGTT